MKLILPLLLFLNGCSFLKVEKGLRSLRVPPFEISKKEEVQAKEDLLWLLKTHSSKALDWWLAYKKALLMKESRPEFFCQNMHSLSQVKNFPLKFYAGLYFYSECTEEPSIDLSSYPDVLQKTAVKAWYEKAEKQNQKENIMFSSYVLAYFSNDRLEKEQLLLQALKLAQEIKAPQFKEWQTELYELSPRLKPRPQPQLYLAVAKDFKKNRQFKKAKVYYRLILNNPLSSFKDKNQSFRDIRQIYRLEKNHKKYLIASRQWKVFLKKHFKKNKKALQSYHNIFFLLAQTEWTLQQAYKALNTLSQMEKELKNQISFFKIYSLKAMIFAELNQKNKAVLFFKKALQEKPPNMEEKHKIQWQSGWALNKLGEPAESLKIWEDLLDNLENSYLSSRVQFWRASVYEKNINSNQAKTLYKNLIKEDPLSYYGLLSHYKTNSLIKLGKQKNIFENLTQYKEYIPAYWLLSLKEKTKALHFLQYKLKKLKDSAPETKKAVLFYYLAKAGSYLPLFRRTSALPLSQRTNFFKFHSRLLFPKDYTEEVEKTAQKFGLEKELIYSVIRQESAFNPKALSPADAFGLMQLRPFTAKAQAKKIGLPYKGRKDLYEPQRNIILGTAFLKHLFDKYNGDFITALAVYNAGGRAVKHWLTRKSKQDSALAFIEDIPYEETRTYVRLLIRNFIFYKLLNQSEHSMLFPEQIILMQDTP